MGGKFNHLVEKIQKFFQNKKNGEVITLGVLCVFLVILLVLYFSRKGIITFYNDLTSIESDKRSKLAPTIASTPTPTPRPIPHGKTSFSVGQGDKTVPQFGRGFIDPYDPVQGGMQTIQIAIKHNKPITKVTVILTTDKDISQPILLKLVTGTNTDGQWQGSWKMTDSYLYTYKVELNAESDGGKQAYDVLTLR